ncbi:hypothetical protein ACS0TY_000761 [Phlomoides rotata]
MQMDSKLPRGVAISLATLLHHRFSPSSLSSLYSHNMELETHPQAVVKDQNQTREGFGKESCDPKSSKSLSDRIIPHILNLYASRATPQDFEIYAPNATFEDPLMCAHGIQQIKSAFYSLAKVFSESRIVDYSIEENVVSPGKMEITIDNKQYYKFMGKDIDVISLIKLHTEDDKIVRHEDWWDKKPIWSRETVRTPVLGRVVEATRRASMLATHALMRFGKDPST